MVDPWPASHDGLMWVSFPRGVTVGLCVAAGRVVAGPPSARSWSAGADARAVWDRAVGQGAAVRWIPA